jgi:hypothetical protein
MPGSSKQYTTTVISDEGRVFVPLPFDPDDVWGAKPRHHIAGTVNGMGVRGVVETVGSGRAFILGPAWRRDCGVKPGDEVAVSIHAKALSVAISHPTSPPRLPPIPPPATSSTRSRSSTGTRTCAGSTPRSAVRSSAPSGAERGAYTRHVHAHADEDLAGQAVLDAEQRTQQHRRRDRRLSAPGAHLARLVERALQARRLRQPLTSQHRHAARHTLAPTPPTSTTALNAANAGSRRGSLRSPARTIRTPARCRRAELRAPRRDGARPPPPPVPSPGPGSPPPSPVKPHSP